MVMLGCSGAYEGICRVLQPIMESFHEASTHAKVTQADSTKGVYHNRDAKLKEDTMSIKCAGISLAPMHCGLGPA